MHVYLYGVCILECVLRCFVICGCPMSSYWLQMQILGVRNAFVYLVIFWPLWGGGVYVGVRQYGC